MTKRKIKINNFKIFRMKKGLTQDELAEVVGVTARTIQFWEDGQRFPPIDKAKKIADKLGEPIEKIFFTQ